MRQDGDRKLILYHYWRSSCSWRVRWALALKGVPYQSVPVDILAGEHQQEAHLKRNPAGFLPCLQVGERFMSESLAILEWLEEAYGGVPLLPADLLERQHVRQLALTIVAGTQPLQNPRLMQYFVADQAERPKHMRHFITAGLKVYDQLLERGQPGTFSHGDHITLADLCLIPQVYNAQRFGVAMNEFPRLAGIYDRAMATEACDAAAPHRQPGATP